MGEHGEIVLVAVSSRRRKIAEVTIAAGADHLEAAERLLDDLEAADPDPRAKLKII